jgi:7-cyano-7-deazaguanine synthase in queuosine biosynthesis
VFRQQTGSTADLRDSFTKSFEWTVRLGNEAFIAGEFRVLAPFLSCSKTDIVRLDAALEVPFEDSAVQQDKSASSTSRNRNMENRLTLAASTLDFTAGSEVA